MRPDVIILFELHIDDDKEGMANFDPQFEAFRFNLSLRKIEENYSMPLHILAS